MFIKTRKEVKELLDRGIYVELVTKDFEDEDFVTVKVEEEEEEN